MKRPESFITKEEFDRQRSENIASKAKEYDKGKREFDGNKDKRNTNAVSARKAAQDITSVDSQFQQLISLLDMKISAAEDNRSNIIQQAASLKDTEMIEHLDSARQQCERDIEELSAQKASIANAVEDLLDKLDELLCRYGSGVSNMAKPKVINDPNAIKAIGSPSNTFNPNEPGAEMAAYDRALWGTAASKLGVDISVMENL